MTLATALVTGNDALPLLAEQAIEQALEKAGLTHANGVLLFLTPEFARHAQQTVTAVARRSQSTQVAGGIASGVFTESGWALDRPAAAVMVFGGGLSLTSPELTPLPDHPLLSYAGVTFPPEWGDRTDCLPRFGGTFAGNFAGSASGEELLVWQQSRLSAQQRCSVQVNGASLSVGVSSGLQLLAEPKPIERSNGYDLERIGGQPALTSLNRALPAEFRQHPGQHLHHLTAVLMESDERSGNSHTLTMNHYRPVAIIAVNTDSSVTLAERVTPGQTLAWAIRRPVATEADMRQTLEQLSAAEASPVGALMFSCIGRGPYFYGGEDRDLEAFRACFPGLPLLGTYGTGQIAPGTYATRRTNRLLQNAVVTALISRPAKESKDLHVQPLP